MRAPVTCSCRFLGQSQNQEPERCGFNRAEWLNPRAGIIPVLT